MNLLLSHLFSAYMLVKWVGFYGNIGIPTQFNTDVTLTCKRKSSVILFCVLQHTWVSSSDKVFSPLFGAAELHCDFPVNPPFTFAQG